MLIVNTFKENPALAVAKMKKASITRRMKMLLSILDNYLTSKKNTQMAVKAILNTK